MADFGQIVNATGTQNAEAFEEALVAALPPIYEKEDKEVLHRKIYRALAAELTKADIALESLANQNYLSIAITDELIMRSSSARDRLQNENAFELDTIRLTASDALIMQNTHLNVGDNQVQLFYVPQDIDFVVFKAGTTPDAPTGFPTVFNPDTNTVTITASTAGFYTIGYHDTGNVVRLTENITVPIGLFRLGWDEGPWDELGFGE